MYYGTQRVMNLTMLIPDSCRSDEELFDLLPCVACGSGISVPVDELGDCEPRLWFLARCRHPVHLDCLGALATPPSDRPHYCLLSPEDAFSPFPLPPRFRRFLPADDPQNKRFTNIPITRFEDAQDIQIWCCPEESCGEMQYGLLVHGIWYGDVQGMSSGGQVVKGPTNV